MVNGEKIIKDEDNMEMREYLIDTFNYNDWANKLVLEKIKQLPDKTEAIRFFSHLINSQNKWIKRLEMYPEVPKMDWWEPAYKMDELESKWNESLQQWIDLLGNISEDELYEEKKFVGYDGSHWSCPL